MSLDELRAEVTSAQEEVATAQSMIDDLEAELGAMPATLAEIERRLAEVRSSAIRFLVAGVVVVALWAAALAWWTMPELFGGEVDVQRLTARAKEETVRLEAAWRDPVEVDASLPSIAGDAGAYPSLEGHAEMPEAARRWLQIGAAACLIQERGYVDLAERVLDRMKQPAAIAVLHDRCDGQSRH